MHRLRIVVVARPSVALLRHGRARSASAAKGINLVRDTEIENTIREIVGLFARRPYDGGGRAAGVTKLRPRSPRAFWVG